MTMRLLFTLLLVMLPALASASTARQASLKELVELSSDIVIGNVEHRESFWQDQRIYTKHVISVRETWRGQKTEKAIEVLTLGGVVDNLGQSVEGSPKLKKGESVLLFMTRDSRAALHPVGLSQGVFYLGAPSPRGQPIGRDLRAFGFLNDESASFPDTLEALRARVKEVLQ